MPPNFVPDRLHIRNVLLFLFLSHSPMKVTERKLTDDYKDNAPSYHTIINWYQRFDKGTFP